MNKNQVIENLSRCIETYDALESKALNSSLQTNRLREVTYNKSQLASVLSCQPIDIQKIMDKMEQEEEEFFVKDGRNWNIISREQANKIVAKAGVKSIPEMRLERDDYEVPITLINKSKGGVGKTTSSVHLAVQAALDVVKNQRVLLIDADPQGSIVHHLSAVDSEFAFESVAEHIKANAHLTREERLTEEKQREFRDYLMSEVVLTSYHENLFIIPSVITDVEVGIIMASKLAGAGSIDETVSLYNDLVIKPLLNDFDSIFIDSSPSPDLMVYNLYYAANHVIFVTTGRKQDYRSFISHHRFLKVMLSNLMPEDFSGYHSVKTLITKHIKEAKNNPSSALIKKNVSKIHTVSDVFVTMIHESVKYELASDAKVPVQLLDTPADKPYRSVIGELRDLYEEFDANINAALFKEA